jgi:hypothetical protein
MNRKIHLKFLKANKIANQKELFYKKLEDTKSTFSITNKKSLVNGSGYFPEDFSLNIYKATSLYKNRYQIEPKHLQKELKLIHIQKKSMKNENIIKSIKKNIIESSFSSDLLRLLKSKKVDRFVKRYLNTKIGNNYLTNIIKNQTLKNNNNNILSKKIIKPKTILYKGEIKQNDEDKINTDEIISQNSFFSLDHIKDIDRSNLSSGKNTIQKLGKNETINSATQTSNFNLFEGYKIHELKFNTIHRPQSHTILKNSNLYHFGKSYYNSQRIRNYNNKKIKLLKNNFDRNNKNNPLTEKSKKKKGIFTFRKNKSSLNNNIINKHNNKNKLIFSFYDPNDKHIKIFKELENKLKYTNSTSLTIK